MKKFFLTLDLEEWYHLDYFKDKKFARKAEFIHHLTPFFDLLDIYSIKITVFVLAELAVEYPELIKMIASRGHEIACHGFDHELLYNKTNEQFRQQVIKAKQVLSDISGQEINGYRASCFSMDREKLNILKEIGFKFDSSYIRFSQHSLYRQFNLDGYVKIDDLIYMNDNFFEFEIPTLKVAKFCLPISGGGYFRLIPQPVFRYFFNRFARHHKNFTFYIHPFELYYKKIDLIDVDFKTKLRFNIGRKNLLRKLEKFILEIQKKGYQFMTMDQFITNYHG